MRRHRRRRGARRSTAGGGALGPTTTLIANAGGALTAEAGAFSATQLAAVVDLNLIGVANCIEAVLPGMLARRAGHLVAVSSLAGYRGLPGSAAYSAAKAALTNMMESLRIDLCGTGVDVTVIAPGFVRTKPGRARRRTVRSAWSSSPPPR